MNFLGALACVWDLRRPWIVPSTLWIGRLKVLKGEHHQKDYAVMEMEIFALGYLVKVESGVLEKTKPTEYRWHGPVKCEEWDSNGRLLYRTSEMAVKFI